MSTQKWVYTLSILGGFCHEKGYDSRNVVCIIIESKIVFHAGGISHKIWLFEILWEEVYRNECFEDVIKF